MKEKQLISYKDLYKGYTDIWKIFFRNSLNDEKLNKPLTRKILKNISHKITRFLLYLHTQETFLYKDLKKASREKNKSKIMNLGPFASVLSYILTKAKSKTNS
jgi:hypothetical protein